MNTPRVLYFGVSTEKFADQVGGWSNVDKMGLREAIIYDTATKKERSYTKSDVSDLVNTLQAADLVVSFNQNQFDYKVLSSYSDANFEKLSNFDMLEKIEETLNFRVSRDNLAQNTLGGSRNERANSKIGSKVDIDKKLFAHACKEGYLLYQDKITGKKDRCDTSDWAETARNLSQSKRLIAETKESIKNNITEHSDNFIPNPPTPPTKPWQDKFETNEDYSSLNDQNHTNVLPNNSTKEQLEPVNQLTNRAHNRVSENWEVETPSYEFDNKTQFAEIAQNIYKRTTNRQAREWYAYNEMARLYGSAFSFQQFMHAIGRVSKNSGRNRKLESKGFRYNYIDRSGTLASEWVIDNLDIVNIKEELARGI